MVKRMIFKTNRNCIIDVSYSKQIITLTSTYAKLLLLFRCNCVYDVV